MVTLIHELPCKGKQSLEANRVLVEPPSSLLSHCPMSADVKFKKNQLYVPLTHIFKNIYFR
jgi:hypothetical protein